MKLHRLILTFWLSCRTQLYFQTLDNMNMESDNNNCKPIWFLAFDVPIIYHLVNRTLNDRLTQSMIYIHGQIARFQEIFYCPRPVQIMKSLCGR